MATTRREFLEAGTSVALLAALGDRGPKTAAQRPNFLVLVVDTLRADHVGAYGGRAQTPSIDALAARGLRFTHFYPEAMPTVPARRSIMTGRRVWPWRNWHRWSSMVPSPGWAPIRDPDDTFTTALRRAGYWTGYVTDNPFLGFSPHFASFRGSFARFRRFGGQVGRGEPSREVSKSELEHWLVPELRVPSIEGRVGRFLASGSAYWEDESRSWAARVLSEAAQQLGSIPAGRPFALVVDTFEPHEPWTPPRSYVDLYGDRSYSGPEPSMGRYTRVKDWLGPRRAGPVLSRMRDLYAAEVTMTDRWIGTLTARLSALGHAENTVVVLVSDHGHLLGEHGWTGKISSVLHPELIHVPCIVADPRPGRAHGRATSYLAQTHDIGPTLLSLAGVRPPEGMDGQDLSPLLRGRAAPGREFAYGGYANWQYARTAEWAFVSSNRGRGRRLYDLDRDPREARDISARHPKRIDNLYRAVARRAGGRAPSYD